MIRTYSVLLIIYLCMHTMGVGVWYGVGTWECPYF